MGRDTPLNPTPATRSLGVRLARKVSLGAPVLPERYGDHGLLGSGGMGEVRRVWDRQMCRFLAMKFLREDIDHPSLRARFLQEAKLTARLQHPGIIVVHDQGVLSDGRPWLTMKEIAGQNLAEILVDAAAARDPLSLRRLVDKFASICEAVAYAHSVGVVHSDIKPLNLMIGANGEALVLDWGLARVVTGPSSAPGPTSVEPAGTPGYLPPERLECPEQSPNPSGDVYALGVVLSEVLRCTTCSVGTDDEREPQALAAYCNRARASAPDQRPTAAQLAQDLRDWLDGVRDRERAEQLVMQARDLEPVMHTCRAAASRLRTEASDHLAAIAPYAPESEKRPAWKLEDQAEGMLQSARRDEVAWLQTLHAALKLAPDLSEAHAKLAEHYRHQADRATAGYQPDAAVRFEALVRVHDRGQLRDWLDGKGALSVRTEPPAEVTLHRYRQDGRRLVAELVGSLGRTPIEARVLSQGSYLLVLNAPGCEPVRYPVALTRGAHWHGCPPGSTATATIELPPIGTLKSDECYVPSGWFSAGDDPEAADALDHKRWWIDGFVLHKYPVTNAQYLAFLNDLVQQGREQEALEWLPRERGQGATDQSLFRFVDGAYTLDTDWTGTRWQPDWPVVMVTWHAANAYAAWAGDRCKLPLRLPTDLEWEKAARGVDGRRFPWGNHLDPTWTRMLNSQAGQPVCTAITAYPIDESPYGVRGLGGNVRDWCHNAYERSGPDAPLGRPRPAALSADNTAHRMIRGGCWASPARMCRSAARFANLPDNRLSVLGFRLARSL